MKPNGLLVTGETTGGKKSNPSYSSSSPSSAPANMALVSAARATVTCGGGVRLYLSMYNLIASSPVGSTGPRGQAFPCGVVPFVTLALRKVLLTAVRYAVVLT